MAPCPVVAAGRARRWALIAALVAGITCVLSSGPAQGQTSPRTKAGSAAARPTFAQLSADATKAREAERVDEAITLYRRALAIRPSWDEGQWYLGSLLYETGSAKEARAAFTQVLRVHPEHAGAMAMSGLCAFQLGEHDAALRQLLRARQLNIQKTPDVATVVRYHTGILLTRFGEFEAGNQVLTELAAEGQASPHVIDAFGLNVLRMPMLPAEIPADARARVQLAGRAGYAMAGRQVGEARQLLESLVAEHGDTANVRYVWGVFLLAADPARALEEFRAEIARSPSHVPARLQIAFELVKQGDPAAARPYAEQAVQIEPEQFGPRLALGQVHLGLGDVQAAIGELEKAVRLAPGSSQTHYMLSVAYARAGRQADAERERKAFSKLSDTPRGSR